MTSRGVSFLVVFLSGTLLGLFAGWQLWAPTEALTETQAPAFQLPPTEKAPHGALVLERKPDPAAKPKQKIPPKHKAERMASVTVQSAKPDCPPTTVDMTLVRAPDGSQRVITSSPDGPVIGGVDIPVVPAGAVRNLSWAAGVSYAPQHRGFGGWLDRDMGPFRVGVELTQDRMDALEVRAKLGVRF